MVTLANATEVAAVAGLAVGGWFYAALYPTSQIFGRVIIAGNDPGEIALTYDDGPNPLATPKLLETLAREDEKATFFLIGDWVRREPHLVREIATAGHAIGNHTMTHPWLSYCSSARVRTEIADSKAIIEDRPVPATAWSEASCGAGSRSRAGAGDGELEHPYA